MSYHRTLLVLILTMSVIVFTVVGSALGLLYSAAFNEERSRLVEAAQSQARLMEAVARFDHEHSLDYPGGEHAASIDQFRDAHQNYDGFGKTGEFTLAYRHGDSIKFLFRHKHSRLDKPEAVPFDSSLAEPMRLALSGQSGSIVGLDYRGTKVLAAYEPVALLNLGIVAKIDLTEVRAPFIRAGGWVILLALTLISVGAWIFLRISNPLLKLLQEREEQLDLILTSTNQGIFGLDGNGQCRFANRACATLLGYESELDLIGQDIHELVHKGQRCSVHERSHLCRILQSLGPREAVLLPEERLCRADGACFAASVRFDPMMQEKRVVGTVVTFEDITERKEQKAELVQAQKLEAVGQLTGGIAHDFNNLLTIILGNLRFVTDTAGTDLHTDIKESLQDALTATQDGAALIERLLGFARKQSLNPRAVDVAEFLHRILRLLKPALGAAVDLQIETATDVGSVRVDPHQLENAILNLALNARDAMPDGGVLRIRATRSSPQSAAIESKREPATDCVVIEVVDDGAGMSPAVAARAMEPFYTTKDAGKGTGLGLSMAYGFAEQSGGSLTVDSVLGHGTTVRLRLPLEQAEEVPSEKTAEIPGLIEGTETVLVVEDEIRVLALACRHLTQLGYKVIEACGPEAAQEIVTSQQPLDLLLTDIVMPGRMNGYELASWAERQRPNLKVLLTTGYDAHSGSIRCSWPVLKKPYTQQTLAHAVRKVLDELPSIRPEPGDARMTPTIVETKT